MGRVKGMKHKSDLRQAVLTTFFAEVRRHKCIWRPNKVSHTAELYEERMEAWRMVFDRLKQTYSPEVLEVMKMGNIDGLKNHYRCHKDKRAKTIKNMASQTDQQRLLKLQNCLDKRLAFLDDDDEDAEGVDVDVDVPVPPPAKVLRLEDFNDAPPGGYDFNDDAEMLYDANKIELDPEDGNGDDYLNDFLPSDGQKHPAGPKDKIHHYFEFLKAEVRDLPKARQQMLLESFFIQLTEARKWCWMYHTRFPVK